MAAKEGHLVFFEDIYPLVGDDSPEDVPTLKNIWAAQMVLSGLLKNRGHEVRGNRKRV